MKVFRRLLGFLAPYRRAVSWSFLLAALAMGTGVLIPYLVGRTVDRVRSEQSSADRLHKVAAASAQIPYDEVADQVGSRLERQQVRRCMDGLTQLQREAITMAYYGGHTYREVSTLLDIALPTVKTRMRDGLIRLRDCLNVEVTA